MPARLSQDRVDEITLALKSGLSIRAVARQLGYCQPTVSRILRGREYANSAPVYVTLKCSYCGEDFKRNSKKLRKSVRVYCQAVCRDADRSGHHSHNWKGGQINFVCECCGTAFTGRRDRNRRFCSRSCASKLKGRKRLLYPSRIEMDKACCRRRRGRKRNIVDFGSHTEGEWQALLHRYGHRCAICGRKKNLLTRDHIVPLALNGPDYITNIQPLCRSCNSKKGAQRTQLL